MWVQWSVRSKSREQSFIAPSTGTRRDIPAGIRDGGERKTEDIVIFSLPLPYDFTEISHRTARQMKQTICCVNSNNIYIYRTIFRYNLKSITTLAYYKAKRNTAA